MRTRGFVFFRAVLAEAVVTTIALGSVVAHAAAYTLPATCTVTVNVDGTSTATCAGTLVQPNQSPPPPPPPPPTVTGAYWVYADALAWADDWSFNLTANYNDSTQPYAGTRDLKATLTGPWGGWQPATVAGFSLSGYNYFMFALRPTRAGQQLSAYFMYRDPNPPNAETLVGNALQDALTGYGPVPVANQWGLYKIPLSAFGNVAGKTIMKFAIQDQTGSAGNTFYLDNVGFLP